MSRKKTKKEKNQQRPPSPSVCRDCGATRTIPRYSYFKAVRPKCLACGGLMEYTGSWRGTRDNGRR